MCFTLNGNIISGGTTDNKIKMTSRHERFHEGTRRAGEVEDWFRKRHAMRDPINQGPPVRDTRVNLRLLRMARNPRGLLVGSAGAAGGVEPLLEPLGEVLSS